MEIEIHFRHGRRHISFYRVINLIIVQLGRLNKEIRVGSRPISFYRVINLIIIQLDRLNNEICSRMIRSFSIKLSNEIKILKIFIYLLGLNLTSTSPSINWIIWSISWLIVGLGVKVVEGCHDSRKVTSFQLMILFVATCDANKCVTIVVVLSLSWIDFLTLGFRVLKTLKWMQ